jgi:hypothetical protein
LVYSNGIVALGVFASILVVIFKAREQAMLPLYAIGVFISFTLSQWGMVRHWIRTKAEGWLRSVVINGIGGSLTAIVFVVIIVTRLSQGSWVVLVLVPAIVVIFRGIEDHYRKVSTQLSIAEMPRIEILQRTYKAVVLLPSVHMGVAPALELALRLAPEDTTAIHVDLDDAQTAKVEARWDKIDADIELVILPSPFRSLVRPILRYINEVDNGQDRICVILPEFVPSRRRHHFLHSQTAFLIKASLLFRKRVVVISVPHHLGE